MTNDTSGALAFDKKFLRLLKQQKAIGAGK